jgi:hypothetical protein
MNCPATCGLTGSDLTVQVQDTVASKQRLREAEKKAAGFTQGGMVGIYILYIRRYVHIYVCVHVSVCIHICVMM